MKKSEKSTANWLHLIATIKSAETWFHSAHFLTNGPSFIANHELLYKKIYETMQDWFDQVTEKGLSLTRDDILADPETICKHSHSIISEKYVSLIDRSEEDIQKGSLIVLVNILQTLDFMREKSEYTAGAENLISGIQDQLETFIYFFRRSLKV